MATIVMDTKSSKEYILLGSGVGIYKSTAPSWLFGSIAPDEESGTVKAICACDAQGKIVWLAPSACKVVLVDGKSPEEYLKF